MFFGAMATFLTIDDMDHMVSEFMVCVHLCYCGGSIMASAGCFEGVEATMGLHHNDRFDWKYVEFVLQKHRSVVELLCDCDDNSIEVPEAQGAFNKLLEASVCYAEEGKKPKGHQRRRGWSLTRCSRNPLNGQGRKVPK
eukprot:1165634-Amphidinium_carterae.1